MTIDFLSKLKAHGIDPGGELVEGKLTRATCSCKPHKKGRDANGWYLYHADEPATLTWGCWNSECPNAAGGTLTAKSETALSSAEQAAIKARIEAVRKAREDERQQVEQATRTKAARLWKFGHDVAADHPYIVKKGIRPVGIKQVKDMLLIPMTATGTGEPESLQLIFPDSSKKFLAGTGAIPGPLYHVIRGTNTGPLYIVEGYATGLSVHEASGASVIVAFSSGKLPAVATVLRDRFPDREIIIAGDTGNGSSKATEAALKISGKVVFPAMSEGTTGTDWNDVHTAAGLDEVARQLTTAALPVPAEAVSVVEPTQGQGLNTEKLSESLHFDLSRLITGADIAAGDYEVSFLVDRLIPENSITLFYAKGGSGKSTLATQIAAAVKTGIPFMGLATLQRPVVVVDFENPRAVLKKRIQAVDGADQVHYWIGSDLPQFNTAAWLELKSLVMALCNPLLIIDTLSSSCSSLDIANNKDLAPVMARIIELRNLGATIVLLHHTPKSDETKYIGASCIYNQCDHILAMYPVRQAGSDQEATDDDEAKVYRLGTKDKSRFDHYHLYVEFDDCSGTFTKAPDPAQEYIDTLMKYITEQPGITQTEILSKIGPKNKIRSLLKNHDGSIWQSQKGAKNATHYYPISVCQFAAPLRAGKQENRNQLAETGGKTETENNQQNAVNTEFACFSVVSRQTEKLDELPDFDLELSQ